MKIIEVWGNGTNVIIKFTYDIGGIWWAASEWMSVSYPYTNSIFKNEGREYIDNLVDF